MLIWLLLALGSALANSWVQTMSKWAVSLTHYSKIAIAFIITGTSGLALFLLSYFVFGFPEIDDRFLGAVTVTAVLNLITFPVMLKAYEIGEFSSVYSMILLTPVFLLITAFIFLGETPSSLGIIGVILTAIGLGIVTRVNQRGVPVPNFTKGNWLGVSAALLWSVSVNFDKLATLYSDRFLAPAAANILMAIGYFIYLLVRHRSLLVTKKVSDEEANLKPMVLKMPKALFLVLTGLFLGVSSVLHNSALLAGPASYTIAIKRTGVLFGAFWGWLFFKERNLTRKLLGVAVAVVGVILILFG